MHYLITLFTAWLSAYAFATPPLQIRAIGPWGQIIQQYQVDGASTFLTDQGRLLAQFSTSDGSTGYLHDGGSGWTVAREPVSDSQANQPDVWKPLVSSKLVFDSSARFLFYAENYAGGVTTRSLRQMQQVNGQWTEQQIFSPQELSNVRGILTNDASQLAWRDVPTNQIMIRDPDGSTESRSLGTLGTACWVFGADRLLENGNPVVYCGSEYIDIYTELKADGTFSRIGTSTPDLEAFFGDAFAYDNHGRVLVMTEPNTGGYGLEWHASRDAVTPSFSIETASTSFNVFYNLKATNDGSVYFIATLDSGEYALFNGPNPESDLLLRENTDIDGVTVRGLLVASNAQRQFIFNGIHPDGSYDWFLATICPADMNRDAIFDNGDIAAFVQTYLDGSLRADFTNDGLLDNADIGEFVSQYLNAVTAGCG